MDSPPDVVLSTPGFYGPGSIVAWYCIVVATAVSWVWNPACRFRPTLDFIAAISYPAIAMIHLAITLWNFPSNKMQYLRANLMHIIIGNGPEGPVSEAYDYDYKNQLLFDKPGPDMFDIFPRVVTIDAALRINDNCFWLCFIAIVFLVFEPARNHPTQQLERFNRVELCLVTGVVLPVANGIFLIVTCGDARILWVFTESALFRIMAVSMGMSPLIVAFFVYMPLSVDWISFSGILPETRSPKRFPLDLAVNLYHRIRGIPLSRIVLGVLYLAFVGILAVTTVNSLKLTYPIQLFIPAVGISIFELDQIASLLGGIVVLFYNIYSIY